MGQHNTPNQVVQNPRRVAVVSSSRADLAHLIHPLRAMQREPNIELTVLATAAMLQPEYGEAAQRLRREFTHVIDVPCPLKITSGADAARAIGHATSAFADTLDALSPDLLVIIADRFEMLAPANAALAMRIPIVHIEGGERSEGAIDDAVRNALTKLSHLHLVTTRSAHQRVLAMGEQPWRVTRVGAASLDHLRHHNTVPKRELESTLGTCLHAPTLLIAVHPVTLSPDPLCTARATLGALETRNEQLLFAAPNADEGGIELRRMIERFISERRNTPTPPCLFTNLEPETWFDLLHNVSVFIGNSSSVLMESPSVALPAVCVGDRQAGRERAANIIDVHDDPVAINNAIARALTMNTEHVTNPYGDGHASERIVNAILNAPSRGELLHKQTTAARTPHANDDGCSRCADTAETMRSSAQSMSS
jgi:UDP-hydrolysing UDP-N-acetyl-D-glucosamine 2-epimerase